MALSSDTTHVLRGLRIPNGPFIKLWSRYSKGFRAEVSGVRKTLKHPHILAKRGGKHLTRSERQPDHSFPGDDDCPPTGHGDQFFFMV